MSSPRLAIARDADEVQGKRRSICESRGYCGPFLNEELFDRFNGGEWRGTANCIHCGSTVNIGAELERWERSLWLREFSIELTTDALSGASRGRLLRNPEVREARA
jgi:hypothetical protein